MVRLASQHRLAKIATSAMASRERKEKWQRHQRRRARSQETANRYWAKYRRHRNREKSLKKAARRRTRDTPVRIEIVVPPVHFSVINNFKDTNDFFLRLVGFLESNTPVHVHLQDVSLLTIDAILVLVALIKKRKHRGIQVTGNSPVNPKVAEMLVRSGFYDRFYSHLKKGEDHKQNQIEQRKGKIANTELAARLSEDAHETIYGVRGDFPANYRILIEAMGNTRQHAKPQKSGRKRSVTTSNVEPWWVMLFCEKDAKIAHFAFYDAGVGVLASLRPKLSQYLASRLGFIPNDVDLIHDMMLGRGRSRTGLPFRGKGLPAMAKTLTNGPITALKLVTNTVFADVGSDGYRSLPTEFRGTLICWEAKL